MGTSILMVGHNFVDGEGLGCMFGSSKVKARFISYSQIECYTPSAASAGGVTASVTLDGVDYIDIGEPFVYTESISLDSLSPVEGSSTGGTTIVVSGSNFRFSADLSCRFDDYVIPATFVDTNTVTCLSPAMNDLTSSSVFITVSNNGADYPASSLPFTYTSSPSITSLTPFRGSANGGTAVTVTGANFKSDMTCKFNDMKVAANFLSSSSIVCVSPAPVSKIDQTMSFEVSSSQGDGDFTSSGQTFAYVTEFHVTGVSPSSGPKSGGTKVVVSGYNFADGDNLKCKFDTTVVSAVFLSSTSASCDTPPSSIGLQKTRSGRKDLSPRRGELRREMRQVC